MAAAFYGEVDFVCLRPLQRCYYVGWIGWLDDDSLVALVMDIYFIMSCGVRGTASLRPVPDHRVMAAS